MTHKADGRSASLFGNHHSKALVLELERDPDGALALVRAAMEMLEAGFYNRPNEEDAAVGLLKTYRRGVAAAALVCDAASEEPTYLPRTGPPLVPREGAVAALELAFSVAGVAQTLKVALHRFIAEVESPGEAVLRHRLEKDLYKMLTGKHLDREVERLMPDDQAGDGAG